MIPHPAHSRVSPAALVALALALLALSCPAGAGAASAPNGAGAGGAGRASGSSYPAGATRPALWPRRWEFARRTPGALASASGRPAKPSKPKQPVLHGNPARALVAFEAMQKNYYIAGSGLYEGEPFSYLWPFSQALAATVSAAFIPHLGTTLGRALGAELDARLTGLNSYLDTNNSGAAEGTYTSTLAAFDGTVAPPAGPGGPKYYDDNDWVGIEMVRLYQLTHKTALLGSAEGIMAFEMAGWQSSATLGCPGGIPFSNSAENGERNTTTTAPAAQLGVLLYKLTGDQQYLQFAQMAYEWVRHCLLESSGMYGDHVGRRGVVEPALWSYNQGSMIGAGTLLYQATGNGGYLWQARQTAAAALAYFTFERLISENPFFVSVYVRNLMYLDSVTHDPPGASLAQNYVNYAWLSERLSNDLFVSGSPPSAQLLVQAAIVQIYSLLSIPPGDYF